MIVKYVWNETSPIAFYDKVHSIEDIVKDLQYLIQHRLIVHPKWKTTITKLTRSDFTIVLNPFFKKKEVVIVVH
jgi:hypothetical protein